MRQDKNTVFIKKTEIEKRLRGLNCFKYYDIELVLPKTLHDNGLSYMDMINVHIDIEDEFNIPMKVSEVSELTCYELVNVIMEKLGSDLVGKRNMTAPKGEK